MAMFEIQSEELGHEIKQDVIKTHNEVKDELTDMFKKEIQAESEAGNKVNKLRLELSQAQV